MPPMRLTETSVKALPLVQGNNPQYVVRDAKVAGLMVVVGKGARTYTVQRDLYSAGARGQRRKIKTVRKAIGRVEDISLEKARDQATELIRLIRQGIDPSAPLAPHKAEGWTVAAMFEQYIADLRTREKSERTVADIQYRRDKYLADWKDMPITDIKRSVAREKHAELSRKHGKVTANQAMKDFRSAYNLALRVVDNPDLLPDNPIKAVTFNKERASGKVILPEDLPEWWEKVQALPNPLRRQMHALGLLSGLRPGTLVSLRREWVKPEAISIPKMKSGRAFDLPLSKPMVDVVQRAIDLGNVLYPGSPWLFPTRSATDQRTVIATQVWKEKTLPSETGHILRHTYRTVAQRIGIDQVSARLLLDHTVPGIDGVYIHQRALFVPLLEAQEKMSAALLSLCRGRLTP